MLLIPGPVSCSTEVIKALGTDSLSHTGGEFTPIFHNVLKQLRVLFHSPTSSGSMPLVISGSGTLGFDLVGNNLFPQGKNKILLLSTGYFSDEFGECLGDYYKHDITVLKSDVVGESINLVKLQDLLHKGSYDGVVMTHVDTSTGVLNDIKRISELVHSESPGTLVIVDAVCSLGCEEIRFDDWQLDFVLSASQKAVGAPTGLSISMISKRALDIALENDNTVSYYTSLKKWVPSIKSYEIGELPVTYFATPPIQLISALNIALQQLLSRDYVGEHRKRSNWFKKELTESLGLELVSRGPVETTAHGLASVYVANPGGIVTALNRLDIAIAGGIHPEIKGQYIRVGLMGCDASEPTLLRVLDAVRQSQT